MYTQAVEVLVPRWWAWPELKLVAPQEAAEAAAADALDDLSWQIAAIMRQRRWRTVPPPLPEEALGSSPQAAPRRRRLPLRPSGSTPRTASGCTPATPRSSPSR